MAKARRPRPKPPRLAPQQPNLHLHPSTLPPPPPPPLPPAIRSEFFQTNLRADSQPEEDFLQPTTGPQQPEKPPQNARQYGAPTTLHVLTDFSDLILSTGQRQRLPDPKEISPALQLRFRPQEKSSSNKESRLEDGNERYHVDYIPLRKEAGSLRLTKRSTYARFPEASSGELSAGGNFLNRGEIGKVLRRPNKVRYQEIELKLERGNSRFQPENAASNAAVFQPSRSNSVERDISATDGGFNRHFSIFRPYSQRTGTRRPKLNFASFIPTSGSNSKPLLAPSAVLAAATDPHRQAATASGGRGTRGKTSHSYVSSFTPHLNFSNIVNHFPSQRKARYQQLNLGVVQHSEQSISSASRNGKHLNLASSEKRKNSHYRNGFMPELLKLQKAHGRVVGQQETQGIGPFGSFLAPAASFPNRVKNSSFRGTPAKRRHPWHRPFPSAYRFDERYAGSANPEAIFSSGHQQKGPSLET